MRHRGNEMYCLEKPVGLVFRTHRAEVGRSEIFTPSSIQSRVVAGTSHQHTNTPNTHTHPLSPPLPTSSHRSTHWRKVAGEHALAI